MSFDVAATTYDTDFSHTAIGLWLRQRIQQRLAALFSPQQIVLEIGCGTGEDALWLAQHGIHVWATDASLSMLEITQRKVAEAGLADYVTCRQLDLNELPQWEDAPLFDGVFSNFGPVNCTNDYTGLRDFLAQHVRIGGKIGLGVMSPFCLWETLWHGLHLDFKTAFRRFNRQQEAVLADGSSLMVYYPSARQLAAAFGSAFTLQSMVGVGVWLPPSDVFGVVEARPALMNRLFHLERHTAHIWPFKTWADHYWLEMIRV